MNRPARPGLLPLLALLALAPTSAAAEGNRLALDCATRPPAAADEAIAEEAAPDPARPDPARATFVLAPVRTDRDGAGEIEATMPDGRTFPGVTASHTGPFAWTAGTVLNTLTVKGQTAGGGALVLWQRLDQAQSDVPPTGILTKLQCEVS